MRGTPTYTHAHAHTHTRLEPSLFYSYFKKLCKKKIIHSSFVVPKTSLSITETRVQAIDVAEVKPSCFAGPGFRSQHYKGKVHVVLTLNDTTSSLLCTPTSVTVAQVDWPWP